ncbi:MAG: TolC family protein [Pseudomonadota bacterium]
MMISKVFQRSIIGRAFACLIFLIIPALAVADDTSDIRVVLEPEDVLQASAIHFPRILESLAKRRAAEGRELEAQGAFDLVFGASGFSRQTGFWSGSILNTETKQRLRPLGATISSGYRISEGTFPIYENINNTNTVGEFKVAALFSLLRDRRIDSERFNERDTRLAREQSEFELLLTQVGVQHQALLLYWRWVAAGQQLKVFRGLQAIAEQRQDALKVQVDRGARAEIFLTENLQNITRRRTLTKQAERDFLVAANNLSLYLRDQRGEMLMVGEEVLPAAMIPADVKDRLGSLDRIMADTMGKRPELNMLRAGMERARGRIELGRNALKPRLDVGVEVSHDVGNVGPGGISFDSTDTILSFKFALPLQQRRAKGQIATARAELEAVRQARRQMEDQIEVQLRGILVELDLTADLLDLADEQVVQTATMTRAEQRRFESGASDFFVVNVREETAANARIQQVQAVLNQRVALANFSAATVDLKALGLASTP